MNAMKSIPLKRILSAKTESLLIVIAATLATATMLTAFSLSKNYIDLFFAQAENLTGCTMQQIFKNGASNMKEMFFYMEDFLLYFLSGASPENMEDAEPVLHSEISDNSRETGPIPPPAAYNSESVFSAEASVENFPVLMVLMILAILFMINASLSIIFSVCKRNRRSFYATLLVSGASNKLINRCMLYEAVYYCAAAIPLGCVLSCAEIYSVRFAAFKIFEKLSHTYGEMIFSVDIEFSPIALIITLPVIFLSVCRFSKKAVKNLSVKTVISDIKKTFAADIGVCTFSADPKSYKRKGIEFHVAVRNFQNSIIKYLKIIFMTVLCIGTIGMTLIMYNIIGNYNNFDTSAADINMIAFTYSSEIYFFAVTVALSIVTLLCTFSSVSSNIDSNTGEYALMRSAGSSIRSILKAVRLEGYLCCLFGTFFSTFSVVSLDSAIDQIYREDSRVAFGSNETTVAVVCIAAALFITCVTVTALMQSRKMKKLDMIAVLKDVFY
ncbi:MAG: hypothetical protein IJB16_00690 [Clostridia bacterium]|nr:hypothetical protein [Clostridia bacterium]